MLFADICTSYLLGGLLQKMACKVHPRELHRGMTQSVLERSVDKLADAIESRGSKELAFQSCVRWFLEIPRDENRKELPKAAIVGDLYVRDNQVFNQNLLHELEEAGAEVITTPYNFLARLLASRHFNKCAKDGKYPLLILGKFLLKTLSHFDRKFFAMAGPVLQEKMPEFKEDFIGKIATSHLTYQHAGESSQNVMKIFHLLEHYPDIRLFVHINPVFCCPALVSESIFARIEKEIGIPIVSITYDGTQTTHNRVLMPYLHFLEKAYQKDNSGVPPQKCSIK